MKRFTPFFAAGTVLILLVLLLVPQTRWLVRPQLLPGLGSDVQSRRQFIQAHPNDYPVQLAGQTAHYAAQTQLQYARSLVPHFPENASLRANILRYATKELHLNRPDSNGGLLLGKPDPPPVRDVNSPPPTPAQLAAFDTDAAAGERLDPDNAYFPFMRSVGLFAAHRDAEGLAAVTRAGTKTAWREYYSDEVEGQWRISESVYSGQEALSRMAIAAAVLFPHYQLLRAIARLVTVKAVEAEQAGNREEGLTLRRALARCGDLMRAESNSYIGNLVGIAISTISRSRPGGEAPISTEPGVSLSPEISSRLAQKRLAAYCDYVIHLGHPDAAREARVQFQTAEQVRHLDVDYVFGSHLQDFAHLELSLVAGWAIISSLILFLLLGLAAWGLSRLPRLRARRPLPAGASIGIWAALLLLLAAFAFFQDTSPRDVGGVALTVAVFLLVPLALLSVFAVFRPTFRRPLGQAAFAGSVTIGILGILIGLAVWQMHGIADYLAMMQQLQTMPDLEGQSPSAAFGSGWTSAVAGLAFLSVLPVLLAVILSIASRVRRVPASVGLVEGYLAWTPAVVCVLAVFYGGLTLWTVRQENAVNYGLGRSLHGEGQYLAQLTGRPWPGPVQ